MLSGTSGSDLPRVVLAPPWDPSLAGLVADILGESVAVWEEEPEVPALLGQALAISRDLDLAPEQAGPTLSLSLIEPGPRAEAYRLQSALHRVLMESFAPVLL